jgi:hypothetical protein
MTAAARASAANLSLPQTRRLLCQADRPCGAGGVAEKVVDAADEVAFDLRMAPLLVLTLARCRARYTAVRGS